MMTQAFYSGVSGLRTYSEGINVVSNNLANISTVGFRGYNMEFTSLFEKTLVSSHSQGSNTNSVGIGVATQTTSMMQSNGSLLLSDRSTDLAIEGDGWFGVQGEGEPVYTRDGAFSFNQNDDLVTADGYYVLGTMGKNIGDDDVLTKKLNEITLSGASTQEKLRFPKSLKYPAEATTTAKFMANLGVDDEVRTAGASVVDGEGNQNHLRLEFTKRAVQTLPGSQWDVKATTQTVDGLTIYDTQTGSLEFDDRGGLISSTLTTINNNGTPVKIDLGSGYDGIISINIPVVSGSNITDGTIGGDLQGYSINQNAEVIATFTNGEQSSVGKIALYHFQNEQGLTRLSGTRFEESSNSGKPLFFTDASGENVIGAKVVNFKLENSNYDITSGMTELIILQRSYDANSKCVTTADQMMQKALAMDA